MSLLDLKREFYILKLGVSGEGLSTQDLGILYFKQQLGL
jgi:hypothetical protein